MKEKGPPDRGGKPDLRERIMLWGEERLSDAELLALVLGTGGGGAGVVELAWRLLREGGGLLGLSRMDPHELTRIPGVGPAQAARIAGLFAIGRRQHRPRGGRRLQLTCCRDVYDLLAPDLLRFPQERFFVISLDGKNRLLRVDAVSRGTARTAVVHPRDVFLPAVNSRAVAVVVAHNHPSGEPLPSREDLELTERLKAAGEVLGLDVLDHVIIGEGSYVSLAERPIRAREA